MAGQSLPEMANDTFCVTSLFLSKMKFLGQDFGSRYASTPIKDCEDANYSLQIIA